MADKREGPSLSNAPMWTLKDLGEPSSPSLIGWRGASIVQLEIIRAQWLLIPPTLRSDPSQCNSNLAQRVLIQRVGFHITNSLYLMPRMLPDKLRSLFCSGLNGLFGLDWSHYCLASPSLPTLNVIVLLMWFSFPKRLSTNGTLREVYLLTHSRVVSRLVLWSRPLLVVSVCVVCVCVISGPT